MNIGAYKYQGRLYLNFLPQHYYSVGLDPITGNPIPFDALSVTQAQFTTAQTNGVVYDLLNGYTISFVNKAMYWYPQLICLLDRLTIIPPGPAGGQSPK